jgi:DNA-binding MarR family transcriptional regulator
MKSSGELDFVAGFDALAQAVRRARGAGANGSSANGGLSLSQYALLEVLADRRSARVQELAAHAGITASTATRILDALERRGIVLRTRDDEDRRAVAVSLTDDGQALVCAERDWLRGRQRAFYAALPSAEQELAPDLLFRLAALIDELASKPER